MKLKRIDDVFKSQKKSVEAAELEGYELVAEYFVDKTGFGSESEPALTVDAFRKKIEQRLDDGPTYYSFITNEGQFQLYIGLFTKTGAKKCKKIANNTLLINQPDNKRAIRLHNTDIITETAKGLILNSDTWQTRTTKDRINKYLSKGYIQQKDFEWFYVSDDKRIPFVDGMIVADSLNI